MSPEPRYRGVDRLLQTLRTLIGCGLRCRADTPAGRVRGFLIDADAWQLRYVRVRRASEPDGPDRLLPVAALPPLGRAVAGVLPACLTPDELARGLALPAGRMVPSRAEERALHAALHWRPYWHADDDETALHDAAAALGATLLCGGEPFGEVLDLVIDSANWSVPALHVAPAGDASAAVHLPTGFLREARFDAARFDSDVRAAALACAPARGSTPPGREELGRVARHLRGDLRAP